MAELLTVKEVAEIASVTTQAIYQRLKKDLKPYVEYDNGRTALNPDVLKVLNKENIASATRGSDATTELLQNTIESLMDQLATKDAQIAAFQEEIIKQNGHSREQSDKLIALVEQVNDLQKNNQILLKSEQDRATLSAQNSHVQADQGERRGWFERVFGGEGKRSTGR